MAHGERIKELRKERLHMTLEQFGARLGVSKMAISRIENEVNSLTDQMAKAICREFNVREDWLRNGIGEPFHAMDQDDRIMEAVERILAEEPESFRRQVISVFVQLPTEHWEVIRGICEIIAKK